MDFYNGFPDKMESRLRRLENRRGKDGLNLVATSKRLLPGEVKELFHQFLTVPCCAGDNFCRG